MQIGPAGGKKGYQGITGKVGWGIAWYVNGLMVPEITVQRGRTYNFIVEGGKDTDTSAKHHPLYLTTSPEGGYEHKNAQERTQEKVLAGVGRNRQGVLGPTAAGRLCEWKIDPRDRTTPESYNRFEDFAQSLTLDCETGQAATLRWRPHRNTPDLVYYQCYTHRLLGWKIHVVDNCDEYQAQASVLSIQNVSFPDVQALSSNKTDNDFKANSFEKPYKLMPNLFARKKPTLNISPSKDSQDPTTNTEKGSSLFGQPYPAQEDTAFISVTNEKKVPPVMEDGVYIAPPESSSDAQSFPNGLPKRPDGVMAPPHDHNRNFYLPPMQEQFILGQGQSASSGPTGPPLPQHPDSSQRIHQTLNRPPLLPRPTPHLGKTKVFFEGGFIPVIYRNGTFHHQDRIPDPTTPPPGYNRPLPFKGEDSVPFQGTFKPGKPDFSGFSVPKQNGDKPADVEPQGTFLQPADTEAVLLPSPGHFGRRPVPPELQAPRLATEVPLVQTPEKAPEPVRISVEPNENKDKISIPTEEHIPHAEANFPIVESEAESQNTQVVYNLPEEEEENTHRKEPINVPVDSDKFPFVSNQEPFIQLPNKEPVLPVEEQPFGPSIDNETDYSILSHVLSLIQEHAQPPPTFRIDKTRTARSAKPDHIEGHDHSHHDHQQNSTSEKSSDSSRNSAFSLGSSPLSCLTLCLLSSVMYLLRR